MKKIAITFIFMSLFLMANAQQQYQFYEVNHSSNQQIRYKLYQTFNMWTFLKLDTQSGEITQVQYSVDSPDVEVYLGSPSKIVADSSKVNGRFELYPTSNNWTFILLDQIDGDAYHVQWGHSKKDRIIYKIKYAAFN